MSWADKAVANPQGYERAVLFPRARDALKYYIAVRVWPLVSMPICVCPEIAGMAGGFLDVDSCGMAPGTQLYGYRNEHIEALDLDPLMTGWWSRGRAGQHRIVSFGSNKILPLVGGGAFLTDDTGLAAELSEFSFFPGGDNYADQVRGALSQLEQTVYHRRQQIKIWDRFLGDMLARVEHEQVMPWNVMRLAAPGQRGLLIDALRHGAIAVSINYPIVRGQSIGSNAYPGAERWQSQVISFPLYENTDAYVCEGYIRRAAAIVSGVLNSERAERSATAQRAREDHERDHEW